MSACHLVVALLASAPSNTSVGICIVGLSCVFVMSFAYGWGPIAWTVCSEIYPMCARPKRPPVWDFHTEATWTLSVKPLERNPKRAPHTRAPCWGATADHDGRAAMVDQAASAWRYGTLPLLAIWSGAAVRAVAPVPPPVWCPGPCAPAAPLDAPFLVGGTARARRRSRRRPTGS